MTDLNALKREAERVLALNRTLECSDERDDLIQRLLPALEDARRYRFMCSEHNLKNPSELNSTIDGPPWLKETWDKAIDAAMKKADEQ